MPDPTVDVTRFGVRRLDDGRVRVNINGVAAYDFDPPAAAEVASIIRVILGLETPDA